MMNQVNNLAKGIVVELAPPHAQNAWGSRDEKV